MGNCGGSFGLDLDGWRRSSPLALACMQCYASPPPHHARPLNAPPRSRPQSNPCQVFISQGFYVVLDYQPMGTEQQAYDVDVFVKSWLKLWRQVACTPNFKSDMAGRIFVDAINEPDSMQIAWEPTGDRPGGCEGLPGGGWVVVCWWA